MHVCCMDQQVVVIGQKPGLMFRTLLSIEVKNLLVSKKNCRSIDLDVRQKRAVRIKTFLP